MYLIVTLMNIEIALWRELDQVERALKLLMVCVAAVVTYASVLWILGLRLADLKR